MTARTPPAQAGTTQREMTMKIQVSICPTALEFPNGDRIDEGRLLDRLRSFITERHPDATITCLQVGRRQGDAWATIDGDDEAGGELLSEFWMSNDGGSDESLFAGNGEEG
jgi:hypothetical protein